LDLLPFEWEVLAAVDGQKDLHALASELGRSEFDVARTVYSLSAAGVIVLDNPATNRASLGHGRDLTGSIAPAREALARGEYENAAKVLQEILRADPLLPEARRLLGLCQAGLGRFRGAVETWKSWARLGTLTPSEEAVMADVERLQQAAEALANELESYRD
jgi:tetratricopeptide (TPR) repeat protein